MDGEAEFGRDEIRAVLEFDADRSLRFGAPLFAILHVLEAISHLNQWASIAFVAPLISAGLLFGLTFYQRRHPTPIPHVSYWILMPWAISIISILLHTAENAQVSIAFVTLALMTAATLLLPMVSFAIALPFSLAAQSYCLVALPDVHPVSLVMVPFFSIAISCLVFRSRRGSLISAERARFFERALHQKQAQLASAEFARQSAELKAALAQQSEELKASRRSLQAHERLAAVGTVAAGVAHQVNNPVGAILAAADFALVSADEADASEIQSEALKKIRDQAIRCGRIVRSLLKLSRGADQEVDSFELVGCVEAAIEATADAVNERGGDLVLSVRPGATGARVRVSQTELSEVFINLIQNALESQPEGARISIDVKIQKPGIEVCVRDNGPGVLLADAAHLFEPFFSSRARHGGTGLGLSVAERIVSDFGGRIWLGSKEQGASHDAEFEDYLGAAFHVWLPLEKQEA